MEVQIFRQVKQTKKVNPGERPVSDSYWLWSTHVDESGRHQPATLLKDSREISSTHCEGNSMMQRIQVTVRHDITTDTAAPES